MKNFFLLLGLAGALPAGTIVYDSGGPDGANGITSAGMAAENFTIASPTVLNQLVFFGSANVNDVASQFDGTIGFRILSDNAGAPGSSLAAGSDPFVVLIDNHTLTVGTEEYRFVVNLGSISLNPGTYWLALHEGAIGSPADGTPIYWDTTSSTTSALPQKTSDTTGTTGYTQAVQLSRSLSFQLVSTPEPGTTGLFVLGAAAMWFTRKRFVR